MALLRADYFVDSAIIPQLLLFAVPPTRGTRKEFNKCNRIEIKFAEISRVSMPMLIRNVSVDPSWTFFAEKPVPWGLFLKLVSSSDTVSRNRIGTFGDNLTNVCFL